MANNRSNLKSIDLKNVRILTGGALSDCVALESVTLPDSLITLGGGVFSGCARLHSIKGGKNVRQIGDGCFSGCWECEPCRFGGLYRSRRPIPRLHH